jgi:osmoprotectant transport system permease protein
MGGLSFLEWLDAFRDDVFIRIQEHAILSLLAIAVSTVVALVLAITFYRSRLMSDIVVKVLGVAFTIPSIAFFPLAVSLVGKNLSAVIPVLVVYALLPVTRNALVGLQSVDATMLDAARGMGMGRWRILWQVELPLAWPVILAGIRVSAQLTVGLVTIAAFVFQIGLGTFAFDALNNLGSANTLNMGMASVLFVVIIALVFDAVFVLVRRFTTPRGLRV